jgi:TRAP-type C4-dicarboxylate transport system substrate-binding protein
MSEQERTAFSSVKGNIRIMAAVGLLALMGVHAPAVWGSSSKHVELSYAWYQPANTLDSRIIQWWADEVQKRTKGAVTIKVYWGGTLAGARETAEAVRTGTADMGCTVWSAYYPQQFSLYSINDGPIPFQNKPLAIWKATERLSQEFSKEFDAMLTANNVRRLTYYGVGNLHIISKKPISKLSDFKGLKIRCSGPLHTTLLKAVGAAPMNLPAHEAYDALQKGVLDGSVASIDFVNWFKYYETCKYFTKVGMGGSSNSGTMINLDVWKKLDPGVQKVFTDLRKEYPDYAAKMQSTDAEAIYKMIEQNGVKTIQMPASEVEAWKNLAPVKGLPDGWVSNVSRWSGLQESRLREMMRRYEEIYTEFTKQYPLEW